jgi:hypothetical protein
VNRRTRPDARNELLVGLPDVNVLGGVDGPKSQSERHPGWLR